MLCASSLIERIQLFWEWFQRKLRNEIWKGKSNFNGSHIFDDDALRHLNHDTPDAISYLGSVSFLIFTMDVAWFTLDHFNACIDASKTLLHYATR